MRERLDRLAEPHVAPLVALAAAAAAASAGSVPHPDPADGGVNASVLILLEAPGPKATAERGGSGFISLDNDDPTAERLHLAVAAAGLPRDRLLAWNAVPWYIGDEARIRAAGRGDLLDAAVWLHRAVCLLPDLRAVVAGGRAAQRAWGAYMARRAPDTVVIPAPHPSVRGLARPGARDRLVAALALAEHISRPA